MLIWLTLLALDATQFGRVELTYRSSRVWENPIQEVRFAATLRSPSGRETAVDGFWDGGSTYRVRFQPNETGVWQVRTDSNDRGLNGKRTSVRVGESKKQHRFAAHGPIRVAATRRHLEHADGTPFFWLADTAWNGPLHSTPADWSHFLEVRKRQEFNAVQWVATQWRGAPQGSAEGQLAYTGRERIQVNPALFQRLDARADAVNDAGLLNVIVMLWAIASPPGSEVNPGVSLPEDQAILLARYMVARWQAHHVAWLINGDGDYRGEKAERWRKIGRGVFGGRAHAPVSLHPGGLMWAMDEFRDEEWLDVAGYQSAHGDSERNRNWILTGEPATRWRTDPPRPQISLEAPYERTDPLNSDLVRRNHYWSMLNAPSAGITYGCHSVWAWSDGIHPPAGHGTTVWPHWKETLELPVAGQLKYLARWFSTMPYWTLRPVITTPERVEARSEDGRHRLVYCAARCEAPDVVWLNPRTGAESPTPTDGGDWFARGK